MSAKAINLFLSYSHIDEPYFKVFNDGLKNVIQSRENFNWKTWSDQDIHVGTFWDTEIQNKIRNCNIAVLLVSLGFMASKYIKEKEYGEFIKHYKEKGILIVPILFAPCDFNGWEDLGKLQFFKPKGADYGRPEVENFTYADLIEFNKRDNLLLPNPNIDRYHLALVKKIEESYASFLLQHDKKEVIQPSSASNINKLADYPKPSIFFTGREKEKKEFKKTFESFRVFAVEGLGGTGKTQFATKCIEEHILNKNLIIWLNGSNQSNFDVFVETAGYGDVLKGEKKTDLALYSGFKDLIERDKRIIFWDNFNEYEDTAFSKFLSFASPYLKEATIILITKTDPYIDGITSLPIVKLEGLEDDAFEFAKKLKTSTPRYNSISDTDLEKICMGTEGHPLAIEFSMWLMGRGKTADDIMTHMPELASLKKVEEFSKRLFLDIFNHPNTTEEERECLLRCSVFKEKISEEEIRFLYDGKDIFHLIAGLIDKLLFNLKEGYYEIHPLVRSFSYEKLIDKKAVHKKAANYFISKKATTLDAALEEKIYYHLSEAEEWNKIADLIEVSGDKFIQQGQIGLLIELFNKLSQENIYRPVFEIFNGDIAQIKGDWNKAIIYYKKASESSKDNAIYGEGMIKYGEIIHKKGNIKEALPFYEEGYRFSKQNNFSKQEARALNDIGLVYGISGDLDKAYKNLTDAFQIRVAINDKDGIASSLGNIGSIYSTRGEIDQALKQFEESLKIYTEIGAKEGIAMGFTRIGSIYETKGETEKALQMYENGLRVCEEIGDKEGIAVSFNCIGGIFDTKGEIEQALQMHEKSLRICEEIGDKPGVANTLALIGSIHSRITGEIEQALQMHEKSLKISKEIGDKGGIASSLNSIGALYLQKEEINEALKRFEQSLKIYEEIGDKQGIANSLSCIGSVFEFKKKFKEALEKFEESLKIFEGIGNKSSTAISLNNIGSIFESQKEYEKAFQKFEQSLDIQKKIGDKEGIATTLNKIGLLFESQERIDEALEKFEESLKIREQIGDKVGISASLYCIASIYNHSQKNRFDLVIEYLFKSLSLNNKIGSVSKPTIDWIILLREKKIGLEKFRIYARQAYEKLSVEMKKYIPLKELLKEPITVIPKVGRNDPCPCNSGKKYKNCHGAD